MSSGETTHSTTKVPLIGMICGLIGGASFGLITPLSPLANEAGSSPLNITIIRFLLGTALMSFLLIGARISFHVPRDKWIPLFFMGLFIFTVTVFYLSAVVYIPVSLAAILFYTYPIIVTIIDPLLRRKMPSLIQLGLSLLAFAGIAIAMGPSLNGLDWRGLGFVALAALSISGTLIISRQVVSLVNNFAVVFYVNIIALILCVPYFLISRSFDTSEAFNFTTLKNIVLSGSQSGFYYAAIIAGLYLLATLAQISTVRYVGPSRTAMFFNIEPIVTILAAVIILGENLTSPQTAGALCVLSAVAISCYRPVRA
ncbi:DMT family transporter [Kiloniella antarctica]|uniref:DMT family transporter n=1 Tax=Kiloniella antarctica TaxID=1550907 RepID=A0ABW5BJ89_9PROT